MRLEDENNRECDGRISSSEADIAKLEQLVASELNG